MQTVGIADLRAHLTERLREVKKGRSLTILDRGIPIARIVPVDMDGLEIRQASRLAGDLADPPPAVAVTDSLALLLADRSRR